jgi:hypothetical protein
VPFYVCSSRSKFFSANRFRAAAALVLPTVLLSLLWWILLPDPALTKEAIAEQVWKQAPVLRRGGPRFKEKATTVRIIMGSNYLGGFPMAALAESSQTLPLHSECFDHNPISIRAKDNEVLLSVRLWAGLNSPAVEIKDNEFTITPTGWDRNLNDNALEIIDDNQNPRLQVVYANEHEIMINGVFPCPEGAIYVDDTGFRGLPRKRLHH